MFSKKTEDLAKQLMDVSRQLDESIRKDTGGAAWLCRTGTIQILFAWPNTEEIATKLLPTIERVAYSDEYKHLYYTVGGVPAVTCVELEDKDEQKH